MIVTAKTSATARTRNRRSVMPETRKRLARRRSSAASAGPTAVPRSSLSYLVKSSRRAMAPASRVRRLANLFLVSGITLLLFLVRAVAEVFTVTFIPRPVYVVWGIAMLTGWAMTYVYGVFVTFKARRWA